MDKWFPPIITYMFPRQIIGLWVAGGYCPQMASPLRCFAALAEVRVNRQVVAHRIFPPIIVGLVVGKSIPANGKRGHKLYILSWWGDVTSDWSPLLSAPNRMRTEWEDFVLAWQGWYFCDGEWGDYNIANCYGYYLYYYPLLSMHLTIHSFRRIIYQGLKIQFMD